MWPSAGGYVPWGVEVHYPKAHVGLHEICLPGEQLDCGLNRVAAKELTSRDSCYSALAPDFNFCRWKSYSNQCYGGLGFAENDVSAVNRLQTGPARPLHVTLG